MSSITGRFENAAGISVLWDLNKAVLTLGYNHFTFVSTSDTFSYLDRNAEELNSSVYFALTSTTGAGLEASAVYNYYSQDFLNNAVGYNVGPFVETQITSYLKLRASVGYQAINFDTWRRRRRFERCQQPLRIYPALAQD